METQYPFNIKETGFKKDDTLLVFTLPKIDTLHAEYAMRIILNHALWDNKIEEINMKIEEIENSSQLSVFPGANPAIAEYKKELERIIEEKSIYQGKHKDMEFLIRLKKSEYNEMDMKLTASIPASSCCEIILRDADEVSQHCMIQLLTEEVAA